MRDEAAFELVLKRTDGPHGKPDWDTAEAAHGHQARGET
jgi:hypothetical protein